MGKTVTKLKQKFKPFSVPKMLEDLCGYWDKNSVFFSGSFEVDTDQYDSVQDWFKGVEAGYSQVRIFGIDGIHSLYGLWFYEGRTSENAPVIYLSGEGEGTIVIADNLSDFFSILASNREYEPFDKEFMEEDENNEEDNTQFRKWVKEKYNILPAKDPMKLAKKAKKNHPDLNKWLTKIIPGWK